MAKPINWITEIEAMELLGYKKNETLRKYCKQRTIPVNMAKLSRSHFVYSKTDIEAHINRKALIPVY
jgi:hypothetical protein